MWARADWTPYRLLQQGYKFGKGQLSPSQRRQHWLLSKKNDELKRAAIACGTQCSGTKILLAEGLEDATSRSEGLDGDIGRDLSIISIDMGIRNLAYCRLRTRLQISKHAGEDILADVKVDTWQRIDVSSGQSEPLEMPTITPSQGSDKARKAKKALERDQVAGDHLNTPSKEIFSPYIYAERSYKFIERMLRQHQPTHILIERQRFRSGGGPAVQEWTLRVGMFEFMLYATLYTLRAQGVHNAAVVSIQPPMVNRYWLSQTESSEQVLEAKPTSAAMKKYKIEQVARILDLDEAFLDREVVFSDQALELKDDFLETFRRGRRGSKITSLPKLDDVSDCLLQGLAWIAWQENRVRLQALKSTARRTPVDPRAAEDDPLLPWRVGK